MLAQRSSLTQSSLQLDNGRLSYGHRRDRLHTACKASASWHPTCNDPSRASFPLAQRDLPRDQHPGQRRRRVPEDGHTPNAVGLLMTCLASESSTIATLLQNAPRTSESRHKASLHSAWEEAGLGARCIPADIQAPGALERQSSHCSAALTSLLDPPGALCGGAGAFTAEGRWTGMGHALLLTIGRCSPPRQATVVPRSRWTERQRRRHHNRERPTPSW